MSVIGPLRYGSKLSAVVQKLKDLRREDPTANLAGRWRVRKYENYAVKKVFVNVFAKFFEVFAKFFKVFASLLRFSGAFRGFRIHSDPLRCIRMHSEAFGSVWTFLKFFEIFWIFDSFFNVSGRNFYKRLSSQHNSHKKLLRDEISAISNIFQRSKSFLDIQKS